MALNFPLSPTLNQTYTSGGNTWTWDGASWVSTNGYTVSSAEIISALGYTPATNTNPTLTGIVAVNGSQRLNIVAMASDNVDCSAGNFFTRTINANTTFTISNIPSASAYAFTLELTHTSGTITWFSGVVWPGGTAPTLTTGRVHLFTFLTDNGGTTWRAVGNVNYTS